MVSMLRNRLYRLHKWLDLRESFKFFVMIVGVGIPNIIIFLGKNHTLLIVGLIVLLVMCILSITRMGYVTGSLSFDHSLYNPPSVGEKVIITKQLYFNWVGSSSGCFIRLKKPKRRLSDYWEIKQNTEWSITKVSKVSHDYVIQLKGITNPQYQIDLCYLDTKKYWETKSDIRDNKLTKLGI